MRFQSALLVLLACGCAARAPAPPHAPRHPIRVMSISECTDQLVLALLPPDRIASVTWLSRDPDISLMVREAARVGTNRGTLEEVVRQHPDLILASSFTPPETRALIVRSGYPLVEVDDAADFEQIRRATRRVAAAVGEQARGEALIARMDRQLAELARDPGPPVRVAAWDGAGFSARKGTLFDAVLTATGAVNVANAPPASGYARPDTEVLLASAPDLLVKGAGIGQIPGLRGNVERHPLVRRFWNGPRTLTISQSYYICGTPLVADGIVSLRAQIRAAMARIRKPLPFAQAGRR